MEVVLGIDIGAGTGVKFAAKEHHSDIIATHPIEVSLQPFLNQDKKQEEQYEKFVEAVWKEAKKFLKAHHYTYSHVKSVGIVSPGIFASDGTYLIAAQIPFLDNRNLRQTIEDRMQIPTAIENDANAGGLAEWSRARKELLYGALGGGWGGAWISSEGKVKFPATDWNKDDATLHLTNEPGYATPLQKEELARLFFKYSLSYQDCERRITAEKHLDALVGPGHDPTSIRAETLVSGTGAFRIFREIVFQQEIKIPMYHSLLDAPDFGKHLDHLAEQGDKYATKTYELFGEIMGVALSKVLNAAENDDAPQGMPVYVAGKPSRALPYIRQTMESALQKKGKKNQVLYSIIEQEKQNPQLIGALVLAENLVTLL